MADPINIVDLQNAKLDAKSLEEFANGDENKTVYARLGAAYPSIRKWLLGLADTLNSSSGSVDVMTYGADPTGATLSTAAFNQAFATGKSVTAPNGTFKTGQIVLPDGATFVGKGAKTIIKPADGFSTNAFWVTAANANNVEVGKCQFQLPVATFPNTVAIYAQNGSGNTFHDIVMPEGGQIGILLVDNVDSVIERCKVYKSVSHSFQSTGTASRRNKINKCYSGPTNDGHGMQMVDGKDHTITDSTSEGANGFGMNFFRVLGGTISGNRSGNSMAEAINCTDSSYVSVHNNRAIWDIANKSTDFGISIAAQTPGLSCIGIKVTSNLVSGSFSSGIALASTNFGPNNDAAVIGPGLPVQYCDVSDNTIVNSCVGAGAVTNGRACGVILYGSQCQHNSVQDNNVVNTDGKMNYGVAEYNVDSAFGTPSNNKISNNNINGATISAVLKDGSTLESLSSGILAYTSTVTSAGGTITSATVQAAYYYEIENRIDWYIRIKINTNGTGAGAVQFTLPRSAQFGSGTGREQFVNGKSLNVMCSGATAQIRNFDGTYPGVDGALLEVSGSMFR